MAILYSLAENASLFTPRDRPLPPAVTTPNTVVDRDKQSIMDKPYRSVPKPWGVQTGWALVNVVVQLVNLATFD